MGQSCIGGRVGLFEVKFDRRKQAEELAVITMNALILSTRVTRWACSSKSLTQSLTTGNYGHRKRASHGRTPFLRQSLCNSVPATALLDFFCLRHICIDRDLLQRMHPHLQNPGHGFFSHCRCHSDRLLSHESSAPGKEIKGWKNLGVSVSSTIFGADKKGNNDKISNPNNIITIHIFKMSWFGQKGAEKDMKDSVPYQILAKTLG